MQRKPRTHTRKAVALTDPKPEFVSIVRSGANMTPFRAMKSDDSQPEITMHLKSKSDTHDIARLVFKGDNFKDEAAVQEWLAAGGYEGATVVKGDDDSFSVSAEGAPTEGLSDIELSTGVTASVFVKPTAAAKAADIEGQTPSADSQGSVITGEGVQPVAKSEPATPETAAPAAVTLATAEVEALRVKFDEWDVGYSDELTFSDTLADGFDGVPPGFSEAMTAVYAATRNAIIVGKPDLIPAIFSDAAALVQKLAAIFPADVPLSLSVLVALDDEKLSAYVIKEEGKEPVLDEPRLRGDLYFPALKADAPVLVAGAQKLPAVAEGQRQKRDMSYKRQNVIAKAASKPRATGVDQSNDGGTSVAQQGGSTDTTSSAGKSEAVETQKQDQGVAVPAAPALSVELLTAALSAAFAPVIKSVEAVGAAVAESAKKSDEAVAALTKKTDEAVAASEKAVAERQTRRGADGDEHVQGNATPTRTEKQAEASKSVSEMRLRGALGMPRRAR